jgi:2,5-diketo-D-gluconate reductase B
MKHTELPAPGLGTYRVTDRETCAETVRTALDVGYRHVDTAEAYGNESAVAAGIDRAAVDESDVFLATKVLHPKFTEDYSAESIEENVRDCLDRLDADAVDLLYAVHWPGGEYDPETTFEVIDRLADEGLFESVGVCNMTPEQIDVAREHASVSIDALQVEMHPLLPQTELRSYCERHDIALVAYAPLGNGRILDVPEVEAVADERDVSPARVSVAWCLSKGVVPIPKATGRDHIEDNFHARDLSLTDDEIARIDGIDRTERQYDPAYAPDW